MALVKVHLKGKMLLLSYLYWQVLDWPVLRDTHHQISVEFKNPKKICPHYIIENLKNGFVFTIAVHANFALL